ncbi:MAG: S9 family peptidase [Saprospiraceae bacterium]
MKKIFLLLIVVVLTIPTLTAQKKQITLEDIWTKYRFYPSSVPGFNFMNDGKHYTRRVRAKEGVALIKYDITNGEAVETLFTSTQMKEADENAPKTFESYEFSADESKLLLATNKESIYRHSFYADFYVWDFESKTLTPVAEGKQRLATLNPAGDKVAYVQNNNLYYKDLSTGKISQITKDGENNKVINGATDWVNEEEFGLARAFYWSPDGNSIGFLRYDEENVKEFTMQYYNNDMYPELYTFKYPKTGEENAKTSAHIYSLKADKVVKIKTPKAEYIPRIKWTQNPNELCVFTTNRHQNNLELYIADATSGNTKLLMNEKNEWYVDIHDNLTFLKDGKHFVWTSEQSGFNHIYLYNMDGTLKTQLTKGDFDVTNFYGVDEENEVVFYQAAKQTPMQREIYCVNVKGGKDKKVSKVDGTNSARFSSTFDYFIHTHSSMGEPSSYVVRNRKGKEVRILEDNKAFKERLAKYDLGKTEFFSFKNSRQDDLNGFMITPPDFDKSKKYPVFMYVYGGPGSQTVKDSWGGQNYAWFQMLAQKGYIVVSVDNTGTGARGEKFKKMTYQELGKYETQDQIEAAKYLADLDYVDGDRIGIFGWSYGGYMSSLCLFKGNDVFKAAIAVAPVTNWKWYDSIYTERYMRTPQENKKGYEDNSPINFVNRLEGHYLLVHGIADDNVHFQNTAEMARALIEANKQYDTYVYPNRNHGIYGDNARIHLYTKMTNFVLENL